MAKLKRPLRFPEAFAANGYKSRSAFYAAIAAGHFPKPFKLRPNGRASAWDEDEVIACQQERLKARDAKPRVRRSQSTQAGAV